MYVSYLSISSFYGKSSITILGWRSRASLTKDEKEDARWWINPGDTELGDIENEEKGSC